MPDLSSTSFISPTIIYVLSVLNSSLDRLLVSLHNCWISYIYMQDNNTTTEPIEEEIVSKTKTRYRNPVELHSLIRSI